MRTLFRKRSHRVARLLAWYLVSALVVDPFFALECSAGDESSFGFDGANTVSPGALDLRGDFDLGQYHLDTSGYGAGGRYADAGDAINAPHLPPLSTLKPGTRLTRGRTIHVGPDRLYRKPSDVSDIARDGDTIDIDATDYFGDVTVWRQNNLTLRGVGGRPHLHAAGRSAEGKAIWVIKGNNTTVENLEFSGTKVADKNGAGIRLEGTNLVVRSSLFHDNEMGILTGRNPKSEVTIENSEFFANTVDYQKYHHLGHNIYIGEVRKFTLVGSYVHDAVIGHNVKTRAHYNFIKYNRIVDEDRGDSSYLVDLPNGGAAFLVGNLFRQSARNDNWAMISYGSEGHKYNEKSIYIVNNTFVNDDTDGVFIQSLGKTKAYIFNNLFVGPGKIVWSKDGLLEKKNLAGNVVTVNPEFVNRSAFDYRLRPGSPAVDRGVNIVPAQGIDLKPSEVYVHPVRLAPRRKIGALDAGAYELEPK